MVSASNNFSSVFELVSTVKTEMCRSWRQGVWFGIAVGVPVGAVYELVVTWLWP